MNTLSASSLLRDIVDLCKRVHGVPWVPGWEFVLWRAALGTCKIDKVEFGDLALLLENSRLSRGWYLRSDDKWSFVPLTEWMEMVQGLEGPDDDSA